MEHSLQINFNFKDMNPNQECGQWGGLTQNLNQFSHLQAQLEPHMSDKEVELAICVGKSNGNFSFALKKANLKDPKKRGEVTGMEESLNQKLKGIKNQNLGSSRTLCQLLVHSYGEHVKVFGEKSIDDILTSNVDRSVKEDFSGKIQDLIEREKGVLDQEENTLVKEIEKIIQCILEEVDNPEAVSQEILKLKNFSPITKRGDITDQKKNRCTEYLNGLVKYQDFLNYQGKQIKIVERRLKLELITNLIDLFPSWEILNDVIEKIIKDPMVSFSSDERLSTDQIKILYKRLRKLENLGKYRITKNIPNFLDEKLRKDGEKIIEKIHEMEKIGQNEEQDLREIIKKFDQKSLFKRPKYRDLYLHIKKTCQQYFNAKRKAGVCTLDLKMTITLKLRQFMEEIKIPYSLHDSLEECAINKKRKNILELGLTKKQKVMIMQWLNNEFHNYYEKQYYCESMETKVKNQLIDIIINLNLDLSYLQISTFVGTLLENGNVKNTLKAHEFKKNERNEISKVIEKCQIFNEFVMKSMIDIEKENRVIKRKLIYETLIPKNIGQLDASVLFEVVKKYADNPSLQTIKKCDLLTEKEKKSILKDIKDDKEFKQHIKKCDKLKSNALMKNIEGSLCKEIEKEDFLIIWSYIKIYGQIEFDEDGQPIFDEDYQDFKEVKGCMSKDVKLTLKDFQKNDLFLEFKKNYPENLHLYEKSLGAQIDQSMRQELDDPPEKKFNTFMKALKSVDYDLQQLENAEILEGNYKLFYKAARNIQQIRQIQSLKKAADFTKDFVEQISFESNIDKALQKKNFEKYDESERQTVMKNLKQKGIEYLNEDECFSKKDIEILREELTEQGEEPKEKVQKPKAEKQEKQVKEKPAAQNSGKKPGKKLTPEQFKKGIKSFDELSNSYTLFATEGKKIGQYEDKAIILEEYKALLENGKAKVCSDFIGFLQKDEDSITYETYKDYYKDKKEDEFWQTLTLETSEKKKEKLEKDCALKSMKAKKIGKEIGEKEGEFKKVEDILKKVYAELEGIKKIA